jgi:plastocyanin
MNPKIAVAVGLVAVFASIFALPQAAFAADVSVSITPGALNKTTNAYDPNPVEVKVGDTVTWTNNDSTLHTVTSGTASDGPTGKFGGTAESPVYLAPKQTQKYTFTEAGEFPYYCSLHPQMVGTVMVTAAGGEDGDGQTGGAFTVTPTVNGQPAQADGKDIEVKGEGAKATAITVNPEAKSIDVTFEGAGDVELTLPTTLISGINSVKAGGQTVQFTQDGEEVKFTVPDGATTVTITGATVVPEFPVVAMILAITMVAIIGYVRYAKSGTNFFGGRV